jgi:hypothetical protein
MHFQWMKTQIIVTSKIPFFNDVCPVFCFFRKMIGILERQTPENMVKSKEIIF